MVIVSDREISIKERATSEVESISYESFKSRQQTCNFHIKKMLFLQTANPNEYLVQSSDLSNSWY